MLSKVLIDRKPMEDGRFTAINIDGELRTPEEPLCRVDVEPKRLAVVVI